MQLATGSNMRSTIHEVFITTSQQSYFCININFWGQLQPESQTPLLFTFEWGQAQWVVHCFLWRQMRATTDVCRSFSASLGTPRTDLGLLRGGSWCLPLTRRDRDMVLQRDRPWFPPYPPKLQKVFCLSQPPSLQGHIFLHYNTKDFNNKCSSAENRSQHWWCFPGTHFPIYISIMPHISVTFIQTYYSWVAKCCLCPYTHDRELYLHSDAYWFVVFQ